MAATEVFANNATTTVSTGGTTAPVSGTTESWTVASSTPFPAISSGVTQFHVADPASPSELVLVTNVSGVTWSVTRGSEGSTPVAHSASFTVVQVISAGWLNGASGGTLTRYLAPAAVQLTDGASIAVNAALGNDFYVTLGGNRTMAAPSNPADGEKITFEIIQDGTGSRTVAWTSGAAGYTFGTGSAPTLSTAAGATDQVGFRYSARKGKWLYLGSVLGF